MTYVGHTLMGGGIGVLTCPRPLPLWQKIGWVGICSAAGSIPDFPLSGWGHDRYDISHSAFLLLAVTVIGIVGYCVLRANCGRRPVDGQRVEYNAVEAWSQLLIIVPVCWWSHLLLDSFYGQGHGIMIGWPFVDFTLSMPMPWFGWLDVQDRFGPQSMRVYGIELLCYGPLVLAALLLRYLVPGKRIQ